MKIYGRDINYEILNGFLNSNQIIELDIVDLSQNFLTYDAFYKSVKCLKIDY